MATYVGEAVAMFTQVINPITKEPITDLTAEVELYAPGKDPKNVPADRVADAGPFAMPYDAEAGGYVGFVDTTGFAPGRWTARVRASNLTTWDNWEYVTVTIKA